MENIFRKRKVLYANINSSFVKNNQAECIGLQNNENLIKTWHNRLNEILFNLVPIYFQYFLLIFPFD